MSEPSYSCDRFWTGSVLISDKELVSMPMRILGLHAPNANEIEWNYLYISVVLYFNWNWEFEVKEYWNWAHISAIQIFNWETGHFLHIYHSYTMHPEPSRETSHWYPSPPPLQGQHCVRLTWPLKVVSHRTGFDPGSTFGAGYYATQLLSTTELGREPVPLDLLAVQTDASQNELSRGVSGKTTRTSLIGIGSLRTVEWTMPYKCWH